MTFDDFNLNKGLVNALSDLGLKNPTAIQQKTFKPIMAGNDIVGVAQTGTGKTYAYLLPTIRMWQFTKSPMPQILIMVPTRELVSQVVVEAKKLTTYMNIVTIGVYGGTNIKTHIAEVMAGCDIIVGTPGRLLDLMLKGVLKTKGIKKLIIDEVDEMLNLGFRTQLNNIIEYIPIKRQNLMFSATMPAEVEKLIKVYTDYYEKIETAPSGAPLENIEQYAYKAKNFNTKANLLQLLLEENQDMSKVLIFASTKKLADALYERMQPHYPEQCGVIHSSKSQNNRFNTVREFEDGTYRFIIATDIIARGLDVSNVTHVINFGLSENIENYIHRIGRTGRAEKKGIAISFIAEEEMEIQKSIEALMNMEIKMLQQPENLEITDELIQLEIPVEHVPFNNLKIKKFKPSGPAFHEKKAKNQKENNKIDYESKMKKKYKKQYRSKKSR